MRGTPTLVPFNTKEQQLCSKLLPDVWAPHLISKAELSHPMSTKWSAKSRFCASKNWTHFTPSVPLNSLGEYCKQDQEPWATLTETLTEIQVIFKTGLLVATAQLHDRKTHDWNVKPQWTLQQLFKCKYFVYSSMERTEWIVYASLMPIQSHMCVANEEKKNNNNTKH